ncbi:bifunctional 2-polyprenyl-6-hydroxyphenol methylase/3-demethylubiquinol 3-O-methyltransferase UbiG [Lutibacter sp.]|uniref:class I SAM-dependent methyltransferase n=1 Tax=Lutibacter sp. TaxID=1925666 RepID=UPI002736052D|nr:class I SAM-dependent methyltransferase [Lutibacter sp.]MDP3312592.1 class I SAM-dependent methyltransferase [Lutibacter sp.]
MGTKGKNIKKYLKKNVPNVVIEKYWQFRKYVAISNFVKSYQGDKVYCPICKSKYTIFGPVGIPERENARCFKCNSLERHRLVYLFLENNTDIFTEKQLKLLHFAPEKAFYNVFSERTNIDYYPCDLVPERFKFSQNVIIQKVDITNIPFDNDSFDFIICNHVLEHVIDDIRAMKQLYKVLKKGGVAILQVPIDYNLEFTYEDLTITTPKERENAFGQFDHVRTYGKDYVKRLINVGFGVEEVDYTKEFTDEEINKFGFENGEKIYLCKK